MIRLFSILLLCASPAMAGPWLRAPGTGFSAATTEIAPARQSTLAFAAVPALPVDFYSSVYVEYGLTSRITIGIDGGADGLGNGQALAFLRLPLLEGQQARAAADIAFGARWGTRKLTPVIRPGLSWGRGLSLFGRTGWTSIEATLTLPTDGSRAIPKLEATLGLATGARTKLMLALTIEDPAPTLSPSLAYRFGKSFHLTAGLRLRAGQNRPHGLTIGVWQEF